MGRVEGSSKESAGNDFEGFMEWTEAKADKNKRQIESPGE